MPCGRKRVEPMAAQGRRPKGWRAQHQSLLHFAQSGRTSGRTRKCWPRSARWWCPRASATGPIEAWIIDDTGLPKKGRHSVGVGRHILRPTGQAGRTARCAVSLSIANHHASLPVAYRLYLPEDSAEGWRTASQAAGVPEEISFKTKPEIALEQLRRACEAGIAAWRGADGRGVWRYCTNLRTGISALCIVLCVAGILSQTSVWVSGTGPLPPKKWFGSWAMTQAHSSRRRSINLVSVKELALGLRKRAWRTIKWRGVVPLNGCPRALRGCAFVPRIVTTSSLPADRKSGC